MTLDGPIEVVKVGGSLLNSPGIGPRLAGYLHAQVQRRTVLIVGGGPFVDALRDVDRLHDLGETAADRLALRALDWTARLLAEIVPSTSLAFTLDDLLASWSTGLTPILAPRALLAADAFLAPSSALPRTWEVTSDSISARVAKLLGADALVLLKSAEPATPGLTDAHFLEEAKALGRVVCLNFSRREPPGEAPILVEPRLSPAP